MSCFEVKTQWVTKIILPLAGVLVGIIGALTGLVAILLRKSSRIRRWATLKRYRRSRNS
jgi:hypothetical protein